MSKQTLYLLGIIATLLIGALLYPRLCCKDCCEKPIENNTVISSKDNTTLNSNFFNLNGNDFKYHCNDNFHFLRNEFNTIQPVGDSINNGIRLLQTYFKKNSSDRLLITGYSLESEKNTSAYPNLGFARANDVKNYLVSKGFESNQFEINGEIRQAWKISNDTVLGPVNFEIKHYDSVNTSNTEDWNALKEKLNTKPLILYFSPNQTRIDLTSDERQEIADIVRYLDNVPNSKISCEGHTDSSGDRNVNIQLGQKRADFAKEYLIQNGISKDKIESTSKGSSEPVADNVTIEGKSKNRRTLLTLK